MMRSATDFLPLSISMLMNLATSTFMCFGSGRISRFGISLRLGISSPRPKVQSDFWPVLATAGSRAEPGDSTRQIHSIRRRFRHRMFDDRADDSTRHFNPRADDFGATVQRHQDLGFFAPYFDRDCLRSLT